MQKFPQRLLNVRISSTVDINNSPTIQSAVADAEQTLGQRGRVLLRPSGTEPLVRVMVEGEDEREVQQIAERLAQVVEREFAAA
jgi:phosphoglucosamine mutase